MLCKSLTKVLYMTPELRHGLYAVNPKELGQDEYEMVEDRAKMEEKARYRGIERAGITTDCFVLKL